MTTQDGYDWPTAHPEPPKPMAPYFRAQLQDEPEVQMADVPEPSEKTVTVTMSGRSARRWRCATCADTGRIVHSRPGGYETTPCPDCK